MENNINLKALWSQQAVPPANQSDIFSKIEKHKSAGLKKMILLNSLLFLTIVFVILIWIYFKPQLWTTKIGIVLAILPMVTVMIFSNRIIPLYRKTPGIQSNSDYLHNLLEIMNKESYMQTKIMNLYFILLPIGIGLYMYEYTAKMPSVWGIVVYGVVGMWFALNWFVLRPKIIRKNTGKVNDLVQQLEKVKEQLKEA